MECLMSLFGAGSELTTLQMSCRGVSIFMIALVLIRISGRRSFGIRTSLDNIIVILLGALLSRAVVGASPYIPIVAVSFMIVILHRCFGWLIVKSRMFGKVVEGDKICLYKNGSFVKVNMRKALVCEEDIMQGVRKAAMTEDMRNINTVYMERNGEITVIKADQAR